MQKSTNAVAFLGALLRIASRTRNLLRKSNCHMFQNSFHFRSSQEEVEKETDFHPFIAIVAWSTSRKSLCQRLH